MLFANHQPRPSRPLLNWLLRFGAWGLVFGCGFALLTNETPDAAARSRWMTGIWCGLALYVIALAWDLVLRVRGLRRDTTNEGGAR